MEIIFDDAFELQKIEDPYWIVESDREDLKGKRFYTELLAVMAARRLVRTTKQVIANVHHINQTDIEYETLNVIEVERQEEAFSVD